MKAKSILWFEEIGKGDVSLVGGKNASLGELSSRAEVPTLPGFAVTAAAYEWFLEHNRLKEFIRKSLDGLDTHNLRDLAKRGQRIRNKINKSNFPPELEDEIRWLQAEAVVRTASKHEELLRKAPSVITVYTAEDNPDDALWVHEDDAAISFAKEMAGEGVIYSKPPREGKVDLIADRDGLFMVDEKRLQLFNMIPGVMCASRHGFSVVLKDLKKILD